MLLKPDHQKQGQAPAGARLIVGYLKDIMRCFLSSRCGDGGTKILQEKLSVLRDEIYHLLTDYRTEASLSVPTLLEVPCNITTTTESTTNLPASFKVLKLEQLKQWCKFLNILGHNPGYQNKDIFISKLISVLDDNKQECHQQYQQNKVSFVKYLHKTFGIRDLWDTIEKFLRCNPTSQCDPAFKVVKESLGYLINDNLRMTNIQKLDVALKEINRMEVAANLSSPTRHVRSKPNIPWDDAVDAFLDLQIMSLKNGPFSLPNDLLEEMKSKGCVISKGIDAPQTFWYEISYISNEEECVHYAKELIRLISEHADLKCFINLVEGKFRCSNCSSEFFCLSICPCLQYFDYFTFEKDPLSWKNLGDTFPHCIKPSCICRDNRELENININFCRTCGESFPGCTSDFALHACSKHKNEYCNRCGKKFEDHAEETYENHHTINCSKLVNKRILHSPDILQVHLPSNDLISQQSAIAKNSYRADSLDPLYEFSSSPTILYKLTSYLTFPRGVHWVSTCLDNPNEEGNIFWRMNDLICSKVHPYETVYEASRQGSKIKKKTPKKSPPGSEPKNFYEVLMQESIMFMIFQKKT